MKFSAFSINTIFIVLMLLGISLIPSLSLQLMPSSRSNDLSVSFSWPGANPEMLEMEVTSKLEGAFAPTKGLCAIRSYTGQGSVALRFLLINTRTSMPRSYICLHWCDRWRKGCLTVCVNPVEGGKVNTGEGKEGKHRLLLSYTITGPGSSQEVADYATEHIVPVVSELKGIENVSVSGAVPFEWVLLYDEQLLKDIKVSPGDITMAIGKYYLQKDAGRVLVETSPEKRYSYIVFKGSRLEQNADFLNIPIKNIGGKMLFLRDLVTPDYREARPTSYYRINGLNRININIFCEQKSNMIDLSLKTRTEMKKLAERLPDNYSLTMILDNSLELKDELKDNLLRTGLTILILLLFVWITSRSLRYLLIVTVCLAANILIAIALYCFFGIEIHLYSLAGITVSFGIIIDNVIVMTDHYRHYHNRKVFMAILAATLTTMGALIVIFNMDNEVMRNMWGFSAVIIINLTLSVVVALFFVPALMEKIPLRVSSSRRHYRHLRRTVGFTSGYERVVRFLQRHRLLLFVAVVLGFGLPVFMIPSTIDRDRPCSELYNRIFSSELYLQLKPWLDKGLGGSLRLFIEGGGGDWRQHTPEAKARTALNMVMTMPHGASLEQMNDAFVKVEQFLAGFDEIETFTSDISSPNRAQMSIVFKKEEEMDGAPERLKNELVRFANSIGNADSDISGVGRGFSNRTENKYRSECLKVVGYNYRKVLVYADVLKQKLEQQKRVKNLFIGNERNPDKAKEFAIEVSKEKLARNNSDIGSMLAHLSQLSGTSDVRTYAYIVDKRSTVVLRPYDQREASLWELQNRPMQGEHSVFRLNDVGSISEDRNFEAITKTNQEYEVSVMYDFIGDYMLSDKVKERIMKEMNREMPIGFRVKEGREWGGYFWNTDSGIDSRILYILLVIAIIYFICAILLESLRRRWWW